MDKRKSFILRAIIESFIESAHPVGSQYLLEEYKIDVSPATVRNDMAFLEEMGLIIQPHTSAGRIPTDEGFRYFVDELTEDLSFNIPQNLLKKVKELALVQDRLSAQQAESRLHQAVSSLARISDNIAFATLPWRGECYYLGLANVLKKPEFRDAVRVSTVVEILEDKHHFLNFLNTLKIGSDIAVFIGRENLIPEMQSCTLLASNFNLTPDKQGVLGILGPTRMNYSRNIAALDAVRKELGDRS